MFQFEQQVEEEEIVTIPYDSIIPWLQQRRYISYELPNYSICNQKLIQLLQKDHDDIYFLDIHSCVNHSSNLITLYEYKKWIKEKEKNYIVELSNRLYHLITYELKQCKKMIQKLEQDQLIQKNKQVQLMKKKMTLEKKKQLVKEHYDQCNNTNQLLQQVQDYIALHALFLLECIQIRYQEYKQDHFDELIQFCNQPQTLTRLNGLQIVILNLYELIEFDREMGYSVTTLQELLQFFTMKQEQWLQSQSEFEKQKLQQQWKQLEEEIEQCELQYQSIHFQVIDASVLDRVREEIKQIKEQLEQRLNALVGGHKKICIQL